MICKLGGGMNKPISCGSCTNKQKVGPDYYKCTLNGHIFEITLPVITEQRDENCPFDKEEDNNG